MKIYTKTGDDGTTMLFGGGRVPKHHLRIDTYGTVDELNSYVGLVRDQAIHDDYKQILTDVQHNLFVIGANLATNPISKNAKPPAFPEGAIEQLELAIDSMEAELPDLKNFILPGGHTIVSYCHLARCVCRRSERLVVHLAEKTDVPTFIIEYLNRLSDYFFVLGRKIAQDLEVAEIEWHPKKVENVE